MERSNIIGWIVSTLIPVVSAIGGSWMVMDTRLQEVEKKIEVLNTEVEIQKSEIETEKKSMDEIREMFHNIDKTITEINGRMQMKEDKKWVR